MGDFSANFHRPESGIHTVEGNLAGSRAAALTRKRESEQREFEARKQRLKLDAEKSSKNILSKFDVDSSLSTAEKTFREKTVGLVTAAEFKKATLEAELARKGKSKNRPIEDEAANRLAEKERMREEKKRKSLHKKLLKKKRKMMSTLSFAVSEEDENDIDMCMSSLPRNSPQSSKNERKSINIQKEIKKNPNADTSFLPDKEREEAAQKERERLKKEWYAKQEEIKKEMLEITYSYWDGSGHRRTVHVLKGQTIGEFLELVRKDLAKEFREIGNVSSDALIYVKEDLIIPQDISFYDLIATRARGKSGPLFNFDVHDDVRVSAIDRRVEKDESHPGKVVERRWYDRNKHIFPASRWEVFDPEKDYGTYTIHGREVN